MAGITERNRQQNELAGIGYSLKYIDEWQPKTILYRHKPDYNIEGDIVQDVGSTVKNVPGNPDYVMRKSKIGQFGWPPSDTCECRWCKERAAERAAAEIPAAPTPQKEPELVGKGTRRMGPHFKSDS
jgi:hypothetical protein